jgi:hypothetical protein
MAFVLDDRVRESSVTTGTGAITLAGSPNGYQRFGNVMSVGDTCWYAIVLPGSAWETGMGTYTALNTLTRTTVIRSSNAGSLVFFAAGTKDVYITQPASKANALNNSFPSGTLMLFQQSAAPIYWTKQVTHNDKALRVVSGAASSGGTAAFSSVFGQTLTQNTTIGVSTMASHNHPGSNINSDNSSTTTPGGGFSIPNPASGSIASQGGDGAHQHAIEFRVQYVDLIICSKDS